jgi:hypothetical protein
VLSYHPHDTNQQGLQKIVARKKNPINDIVDTVGAWLGGRGPGTNPQVQAAMQATRAIAQTADTATGGFGQALLSDAQRMAMTGSSTPSALYKTAAVNLGAAAAGVGAAKVAGKAASKVGSKVVESGVPARLVNKVTGQSVVVHGSATSGLSTIKPQLGSAAMPYDLAAYGWNPKAYKKSDSIKDLLWDTRSYTSKQVPTGYREPTIYVAKTPTKNLKRISDAQPSPGPLTDLERVKGFKEAGMVTNQPLRVVDQMDVSKYEDSVERAIRLSKKIKKAGGKVPKGSTKKKSYPIIDEDF